MIHMDVLQVISFFLFLFPSVVYCKKHCPTSYCPRNSLPIRYPFKVQGQQTPNCTYTDLRCSSVGTAILNLPYSGDFYVQDVDYGQQLIQLYDPGNCLPKRLMSLNFSSLDPLFVIYSLTYTFYSCPSELIPLSNLTAIDCLSNSSSATVATHTVSSEVMKKLYRCNEIVSLSVPAPSDQSDFIANQSSFILGWYSPSCENCPHKTTGLVPDQIYAAALIMISLVTLIMPPVICIGCCAHFIIMVRKDVGIASQL